MCNLRVGGRDRVSAELWPRFASFNEGFLRDEVGWSCAEAYPVVQPPSVTTSRREQWWYMVVLSVRKSGKTSSTDGSARKCG